MSRSRRTRKPNPTTVYWLIENPGPGQQRIFTVCIDAEKEALPVFSYPEEAEMFLKLDGLEEKGWRIAESTARDLVSRFSEYRRAGTELVALDPLPEMMGPVFGTTIALVSLGLQDFARRHAAGSEQEFAAG